MTGDNLEKMIRLADAFFEAKRDPDQISVNEKEREKLSRIHPATLTQETDENGPIAWILVIPTTGRVMEQFVCRRISERELLEQTPVGEKYDALYLCSALVLPEYRGKGIARRLTADAVRSIPSGSCSTGRSVRRERGWPNRWQARSSFPCASGLTESSRPVSLGDVPRPSPGPLETGSDPGCPRIAGEEGVGDCEACNL